MSHNEICVTVLRRIKQGKGENKRLRKAGKIPCVVYGHGVESVSLIANLKEITPAIDHPSIITLNFDGETDSRRVLVKDVQHDYLHSNVIHVDFQQVRMDETITAEVPLEVIGDPIGLHHGGLLDQIMHTIEVECLPDDLPERIIFDVSALDVGDNVTIEQIPLPEGVKSVHSDPHSIAIHVIRGRIAEEVSEEEAEGTIEAAATSEEPEVIAKKKKEEGTE